MKAVNQIIALIISCMLCGSVFTTKISFAEESKNPDLLELAFDLGADTDYINIANYRYENAEELQDVTKRWYIDNAYNTEVYGAESSMLMNTSGGMCYGISMVEILAHNGIISPSDIVPGAENLCDIEYCDEADAAISSYQTMQSYFEVEYYTHKPVSILTMNEQVDDLIALAERNMAENKYFLVTLHSAKAGHAVAGIGIADGNWEFEGNSYDKCILTLDSNSVTKEGELLPYHEKTNIYINSNTKAIYIPAYADYENLKELTAIYGFDDLDILNYRGIINPSTLTEDDFSEAVTMQLSYIGIKTKYDVIIRDKTGNEYTLDEPVNKLGDFFRNYFFTYGSEFSITANADESWPSNPTARICIYNQMYNVDIYAYGDESRYEIDEDHISFEPSNKRNMYYEFIAIFNEDSDYPSPYYSWGITGHTSDKAYFDWTPNGMIIGGAELFDACIDVGKLLNDENGQRVPGSQTIGVLRICVDGSVLVGISEDEKLVLFVDPDHDGVYDTEVEKGDVNCDGLKDAADASLILYDNAQVVDQYDSILDIRCADINGDGMIDGVDASLILAMNAELAGETA